MYITMALPCLPVVDRQDRKKRISIPNSNIWAGSIAGSLLTVQTKRVDLDCSVPGAHSLKPITALGLP